VALLSDFRYKMESHTFQTVENPHHQKDTTCPSFCCHKASVSTCRKGMWDNLSLLPRKSDWHILEPFTEHTGLQLLYLRTISRFSLTPIQAQLPTFNKTYITIWNSEASSSSNLVICGAHSRSGCALGSYSGGAHFDYRLGHWLPQLFCRIPKLL
jgi:hypothetical protein